MSEGILAQGQDEGRKEGRRTARRGNRCSDRTVVELTDGRAAIAGAGTVSELRKINICDGRYSTI
uniref:Uncharacterized protein n=1 Tax=Aegilops tauschii TaxID=37682 RepID=R7W6B7_AEGTA